MNFLNLNCLDISYQRVSASNNKILLLSKSEIIIAGENGKLIKTKDEGKTWNWIETGTRNSFISLNSNNKGKIVLNTTSEIIYSNDRGDYWKLIIEDNSNSIKQSFITDDNKNLFYSLGKYLFKYNFINERSDTSFIADDIISNFVIHDSIIYLTIKEYFYKILNENFLIKTQVKGKFNSNISSCAINAKNILIGGADTSNGNYANYLYKSSDGGTTFDSVRNNQLGYINKIINFEDNFAVLNSWGYIFYFDNNFDLIGSDTIFTKDYLKFSRDFIIIKDIIQFGDDIFYCGRDQSYGYLKPLSTKKLLNYASSQYPVPVYTVALNELIIKENNLFILGNYGKILKSSNDGTIWNTIFPFDTLSETAQKSPWNDFRDDGVYFLGGFQYKNGFRFVGINKYTKPLDIYYDTTSGAIVNINEIRASVVSQQKNNIIYLSGTSPVSYSIDYGNTFQTIPFPDSLLKVKNKSIQYFNIISSISPINDSEYILLKVANLNTKDSINNPNKEEVELIFYIFDIKNSTLEVKKIMPLGKDYTYGINILPDKKILVHGNGFSKKIILLDSNFNELLSDYLSFYPTNIFSQDANVWIATTKKDSVFITTDAGKNWSFYYLNNDTTLYENKSTGFFKINKIGDNKYMLIGHNRITRLELYLKPDYVEDKIIKDNSTMIFPNPASDFIEINVGVNGRSPLQSEVRIYNVLGEIQTTVNPTPTLPASREGARIDVSGLAPGMYFAQIGDKLCKFIKI